MGAGTAGEDDELRTFEDLQPVSYAWEQMVGSKEEQDESQLLDRLNTLKEIVSWNYACFIIVARSTRIGSCNITSSASVLLGQLGLTWAVRCAVP